MKRVNLYSDGGCRGNPGIGGWGTILTYTDTKGNLHEKEISGGSLYTTNNQMEIKSIIEGFKLLKENCYVTVTTDSQYVVNAINKHWIDSWVRNNWVKSDGTAVKNVELWKELLSVMEGNNVSFVWVKGHNGHPYNERCDKLANEFMNHLELQI